MPLCIPTRQELEAQGFNGRVPRSIFSLATDLPELRARLTEKGLAFTNEEEAVPPPAETDAVLCAVEATVDQIILRAMAKIGFNYLARWQPELVKEGAFDIIRRYIRNGDVPEYPLVVASQEAVLENEPVAGQRVLAHLVTVNWAGDGCSIVAQVSLFNGTKYNICLAREYPGERIELAQGHLFNISNGKILELGHRAHNGLCT